LTDLLSAGDVMDFIVKPMQERWNQPKGDTLNNTAIIGDYVTNLKEFDVEVLKTAFNQVVLQHEYRTWPSVKFIRDICVRVRLEMGRPGASNNPQALAVTRTTEAHQYAQMELNKLGMRPWDEGWHRGARAFFFHHALIQLRDGLTPNVTISEEDIVKWKSEFARRKENWARTGHSKSQYDSVGFAARKVMQKVKTDPETSPAQESISQESISPESISMEDLDKMAGVAME